MDVDAGRILAEARALSFPRQAGSPGDARARSLVLRALRAAGLETVEEPFSFDIRPAERALRALLLLCALLCAGAGALAGRSPGLALLLVTSSYLAGGVLLAWAPGIERIYRREGPRRTANVVGRRPAPDPRVTLIVMAHHDSKSQNLTMAVRGSLALISLAAGLSLAALLVLRLVVGASPGPAPLPAVLGGVAAIALVVLSTLRSDNRSPGAVDNAGSVAILQELARLLPTRVPDDVELIFLATGAEEDHMVGAMRWLDAHREDLRGRPAWALNFDGAGAPGRVVLLERFGLGRAFSPALSRAARRAAATLGIPLRGILLPPAMGVDAIPFAHRGLDCLTFASGSLGRATLAIHSAGDEADNLDRDALARVARLALAVALDMVRDAETPRRPGPSVTQAAPGTPTHSSTASS